MIKNLKAYKKLKEFFSNDDKMIVLSLSFIFLSIFLFILSAATTAKGLQIQRASLSSFCFLIGFYLIPFIDMKSKDKTYFEVCKLFIFAFLGTFCCFYWFLSIQKEAISVLADIIIVFISVVTLYYFVFRIFNIAKIFIVFINKLSTKIFPSTSTKSTGIKFLFERLTAVLISVSGALGTVLAIATTMKTLITMFQN